MIQAITIALMLVTAILNVYVLVLLRRKGISIKPFAMILGLLTIVAFASIFVLSANDGATATAHPTAVHSDAGDAVFLGDLVEPGPRGAQ